MRWTMGWLILCFLWFLGGWLPIGVAQDRVVLKNGAAFTGTVLEESDEWIALKTTGGTMRFRLHHVDRVEHGAAQVRGTDRNPNAPRSGRHRGKKAPAVRGFVKAVPDTHGDLKQIRVDRHPAYECLKRSRVGAWVLYAVPEARPHHDHERWVVQSVPQNRTVVLVEFKLGDKLVGVERRVFNHLDYGPEMPGDIQRENALGKEMLRMTSGRFASLRISRDFDGQPGPVRHYCSAVPILGLVQECVDRRVFRRLVRFAWEGGSNLESNAKPVTGGDLATPPSSLVRPLPPNPVAAAFLDAKPGDYAIWREPATGARWREIVRHKNDAEVEVVMQVWSKGGYQAKGVRTYDLQFLPGDYLDRFDARREGGEEKVVIHGTTYFCKRWRSPSGQVEFLTSPDVHLGGLVRHTQHGRVVRELLEVGNNQRLLQN